MAKITFERTPEEVTRPGWMEKYGYAVYTGGFIDIDSIPLVGSSGEKTALPSGTLLGRTYAERDAGLPWGLADPANDDEMALLVHDVYEHDEIELYRPKAGLVVKEDLLPDLTVAFVEDTPLTGSLELDAIRQLYNPILSTERLGTLMNS